jgi:hypothetical protein
VNPVPAGCPGWIPGPGRIVLSCGSFSVTLRLERVLKHCKEEDSSTLNLIIWPLDGALDTGQQFGGRRWHQGKTSYNLGENHSF